MGNRYSHTLKTKGTVHLLSFFVALFLSFYGIQVCPFMSTLFFIDLFTGLVIVALFQSILREIVDYFFLKEKKTISPPRLGYYLSIVVWVVSGLFAVLVHFIRYPEFMFGSHIKILIGYWALGGGIFAQLEYVLFEKEYRLKVTQRNSEYWERLSRRIFEGYLAFTVVPTLTLIMSVAHYVYQGYIQSKVKTEATFLGLFFIVTAVYVAWRIGATLKQDTEAIVAGLAEVEKGNFSKQFDTSRPDELGEIANGINNMNKGLDQREKIRDAFGKFVSPEVAEDFIEKYIKSGKTAELGGAKKHAVILYSDIRGFTPLSESMPPEAVMDLLNRYFSRMVAVIAKHGGIVDKFIGDAIMAVFGLSEKNSFPAESAVKCAVNMRKALALFNEEQKNQNHPILNIGIGIHAGDLVAGYLGCTDRMEFTVIGNTVNIASRIQDQTKPPNPPLLFSKEIADSIKELNPREAMKAQLKGISEPVALYTIEENI